MKVDKLIIHKKLEHGNGSYCFVNVQFDLGKVQFGYEDAWAVYGLVIGAVHDLCERLMAQRLLPKQTLDFLLGLSAKEIYLALDDWNWGEGQWAYELMCPLEVNGNVFVALPMGTELFDGEMAYFIYNSNGIGRLLWQDKLSHEICEAMLNWDHYIKQWRNLKRDLIAAKEIGEKKSY